MGLVSFPGDIGPCAAYVLLELYGGSGDWGGARFEGAVDGEVLIDGGGGGGGGGEGGGLRDRSSRIRSKRLYADVGVWAESGHVVPSAARLPRGIVCVIITLSSVSHRIATVHQYDPRSALACYRLM